jgi:hypothetical protein
MDRATPLDRLTHARRLSAKDPIAPKIKGPPAHAAPETSGIDRGGDASARSAERIVVSSPKSATAADLAIL